MRGRNCVRICPRPSSCWTSSASLLIRQGPGVSLETARTTSRPLSSSSGDRHINFFRTRPKILIVFNRTLEALSSRLLGGQGRSGQPEPLPSLHGSLAASDSPAEADLKRLLARPLSLEAKIPDQASSRLAKVRLTHGSWLMAHTFISGREATPPQAG